MSVIGIVSEFNPFHLGHKHLIDSVRKDGDSVLCVMSGNFVQRAEPAVFDKKIRTEAALKAGADIVLELPFVYAVSSAEIFAENAVKALYAFGADKLAFGCENDDMEAMERTAVLFLDPGFDNKVAEKYKEGISYPVARQAVFDTYGINFDISQPNNILAVEYIKAIKKNGFDMKILPVKRQGEGYNGNTASSGFLSAGHIRAMIENGEEYADFVPEPAYRMYKIAYDEGRTPDDNAYELSVLTLLRQKIDTDFSDIAYIDEGLASRMNKAIRTASSLGELYDAVKSKRYTHSRVRRAVLFLALGVDKEDIQTSLPYCRLLGYRKESAGIMGNLASKSSLPFIVSFKDRDKYNLDCVNRILDIENASSNLYSLIIKNRGESNTEMAFSPVKV